VKFKFNIKRFAVSTVIILLVIKLITSLFSGVFGNEREDLSFFSEFDKKNDDKVVNFAMLGVDEEGIRTDVIMVASLNKKTKKVNIVSVPRDTMIVLESNIIENMAYGYNIPANKTVKLTEVHSYAGKEYAIEFTLYELERLLGIHIDHYAKVNTLAFRNIVDEFGGVEFDVPYDMDYEDPTQNLKIHLRKGMQLLDGKKAEQLVRFRGYINGDIDRIRVQQSFLEAFLNKVLDKKYMSDFDVISGIIKNIFEFVETDMSLAETLKYIKIAKNYDSYSFNMETLQGELGARINNVDYYKVEDETAKKVGRRLFLDLDTEPKNIKIKIESKSMVYGIEWHYRSMLRKYGFEVVSTIETSNEEAEYTKVYLKDKKHVKYFKALFNKPVIDMSLIDEDIDVKIVIGKKETK